MFRVVGLLFIRRWCKYSAHFSREFISAGISALHVCILVHVTVCERLAAIKPVKVVRGLECATVNLFWEAHSTMCGQPPTSAIACYPFATRIYHTHIMLLLKNKDRPRGVWGVVPQRAIKHKLAKLHALCTIVSTHMSMTCHLMYDCRSQDTCSRHHSTPIRLRIL